MESTNKFYGECEEYDDKKYKEIFEKISIKDLIFYSLASDIVGNFLCGSRLNFEKKYDTSSLKRMKIILNILKERENEIECVLREKINNLSKEVKKINFGGLIDEQLLDDIEKIADEILKCQKN